MARNDRTRTKPLVVLLALVSCLAARPAVAQDAAARDAWRFQVTPYLWAAGFGGTVRPDRRLPATFFLRREATLVVPLPRAKVARWLPRTKRPVFRPELIAPCSCAAFIPSAAAISRAG